VGADALEVATGLRQITKLHGSVWARKEVEAMAQVANGETDEEE